MCLSASCSWLAVRLWRWKMWFCWSLVWGNTFLPLFWATSYMVASSYLLSTLGSLVQTLSVSCLASSHLSPPPLLPAPGTLLYFIYFFSPISRLIWLSECDLKSSVSFFPGTTSLVKSLVVLLKCKNLDWLAKGP